MKTTTANQEVLLNMNSSFCKRDWCEKDTIQKQLLTTAEQMKQVCWNGILPELFPEIFIKENNKPLTIWELFETQTMIHLRMGEFQKRLESINSIHPCLLNHLMKSS